MINMNRGNWLSTHVGTDDVIHEQHPKQTEGDIFVIHEQHPKQMGGDIVANNTLNSVEGIVL